jgi:hypothetical protein
MKAVYDLRLDLATIQALQRGTREPGPLGLRPTHGLIGSPAWWDQVDQGRLPVHVVAGVVSGFWSGQWEGGPAEFQLRAAEGRTTLWLCHMAPALARSELRPGRPAEVRFVMQELKTGLNGSTETKVTLAILLG